MRRIHVFSILAIAIAACTGSGKKESSSSNGTADNIAKLEKEKLHIKDSLNLKVHSDSLNAKNAFLLRIQSAEKTLNRLDSNWRKMHPHYEDTFPGLPMPPNDCIFFLNQQLKG